MKSFSLKHLFLVAVLAVLGSWHAAGATQPNVVYLLADDLGWGDLGTNGGSIRTPNIDQLFAQGVRLDNFMGWCVCSPTRAMLLTARHPFRVGTGPGVGGELAREEITIAEAFQAHGYRTGVFGKWHNGEDPDTPEFRAAFAEAWKSAPQRKPRTGLGANEHGFDEAWAYYGGGADYFTRRSQNHPGPASWWHNREYRPNDAGYTEDLIAGHVLEFIRENRDRPFFCYVPFHIVHAPFQAKDSDLAGVEANVTDATQRAYAAMVMAMDKNVAAILGELDRLGLRENTIIVFTSDNGATKDGSNLPFRGGKHSVFEGGTRLPTVVHWPKGNVAGRRWDGLCGALDMFPTLMAMAGLPMPQTRPLDGKNLWPALRDGTASPVESYYWAWDNEDAIRTADWRLHRYFDRTELYDIRMDPGETNNVAGVHSGVVESLTAKMDAWAESLGAALSHLPARLDGQPAPDGEVLEVAVTVTAQAKPKDRLVVPFAGLEGDVFAGEHIEFDLAVAADSLRQGFSYTPFKGQEQASLALDFKRGKGIDQFGREQDRAPEPRGGAGVWEHRVVGLCSFAPNALPRHGLVFRGGKPGTYRIWLDNLRIRHADGTITPVWTNAKDTRYRALPDSEQFTNIRVRAVPANQVH